MTKIPFFRGSENPGFGKPRLLQKIARRVFGQWGSAHHSKFASRSGHHRGIKGSRQSSKQCMSEADRTM